jgi:hypothetical protein
VINNIMALTDSLAKDLSLMDFENALNKYDTTKDFRYAANGEFFKDFTSWKEYLTGHRMTTDSLYFEWTKRDIIPLSMKAASLAGSFEFRLKLKSGDTYSGDATFTGLFVRRNDKWVMLHGHESIKE